MRKTKKITLAAALLGSLLFYTVGAYANPGVVDYHKVGSSYTKAQEIAKTLYTKKIDQDKFVVEARKIIAAAKTEAEKKKLLDKYNKELQEKEAALEEETNKDSAQINQDILDSIKSVAASDNLDLVFTKDSLILGGTDITDQVISKLNGIPATKTTPAMPTPGK